jgi:molybdopterin synthase catalytic subunit
MTIKVQREDFDVGDEIGRLTHGNVAIGGMACFVGLVRDMAGEDHVSAMTLEHYPGMTESALAKLEEEARRRWPLQDVLIIHRFGRLEPGDRIVLVATASAHREASLESCHFLIDWLKTKAPFWKLEDTEGGSRWVSAKEDDDKATERWVPTPAPAGADDKGEK